MALRTSKGLYSAILALSVLYLVFYSARNNTFYHPAAGGQSDDLVDTLPEPEKPSATSDTSPVFSHGPVIPNPAYTGKPSTTGDASSAPEEENPYSVDEEVFNSTLGFQKILAIGLPERSDRKDLLQLMAKYQNVEVDWMDAVKGEDIPKSSWPKSWETPYENHVLTPGEIGNWKSHRNALQRVVDSEYSTALILEDDSDWDVSLKSQLKQFASLARNIENKHRAEDDQLGPHDRTFSPYGSKWDMLWLGICANPPAPEGAETFPGVDDVESHWVYQINGGTACTTAYAVTQKSAREMLTHMEDTYRPTDILMPIFCASSDKVCLVVWPMLISNYKAAGSLKKDSDIKHAVEDKDGQVEEEVREKGESWKIVHSAINDALEKSGRTQNAAAKS